MPGEPQPNSGGYTMPTSGAGGYGQPPADPGGYPAQPSSGAGGYQPPPTSGAGYPPQPTSGGGYPPPSSGAGGYAVPPTSGGGYAAPQPGYAAQQPGYAAQQPGYAAQQPGYAAPPPAQGYPPVQQQYGGYPPQGGYAAPAGAGTADEKNMILIAHWGGVAGLLVLGGLGGWIGPLIAYMSKGNESPLVRAHAVACLNFHITWAGANLLAWIITGVTCGFGIPLVFIAIIIPIIFGIIGAVKAGNGEFYKFPVSISIVK
jgi:uncharacterized Tic20 family protein